MHGVRYHVWGVRYHVCGVRYHMSGIRYHVCGVWYPKRGVSEAAVWPHHVRYTAGFEGLWFRA